MSYKINKTNGSLLVDLIDGVADSSSTDITLVGKNYTGFGEFINENFVKILESFANSSAPSNPLVGQLWWDTAANRLKVWDGFNFKAAGGPIVQKGQPLMTSGDLWINNYTDQMYFYDGTDLTLAGPIYTKQQGVSGFKVVTVTDTQGRPRTVLDLQIAGQRVAVFSNLAFTPTAGQEIAGIETVQRGINLVNSNFNFYGTAQYAQNLQRSNGELVSADQFLPADRDATGTGSLFIQNNGGITLGTAQNHSLKVVGTDFVATNEILDQDYKIKIRTSAQGGLVVDAMHVDASAERIGIFKTNPEYTLDVGGDLRITGDLLVQGTTTNVDTTVLRIADKHIELGITDDSTMLSEAQADGAGIIVKVEGDDKSIVYTNASQAWKSSTNFDLKLGSTFKINGTTVLSSSTLGNTITSANGLVSIGTLQELNVDDLNLNGNTIRSYQNLNFNATGNIGFNNKQIKDVATPVDGTDATTKNYVDAALLSIPVSIAMDITNLNNTQIASVLQDIAPSELRNVGAYAYIHTTTLSNATVSGIDITAVTNKSFIAVDSNGTQNESVLQDVAFGQATGIVSTTIQRGLKRFVTTGTTWAFDQDLPSSV